MPARKSFLSQIALWAALACFASSPAPAQEINAALKELAAAANREGTLTLSWSGSTFAGIQGAARFQAAMNKHFGTNIRINFLPGADMVALNASRRIRTRSAGTASRSFVTLSCGRT